jgi:hypothetical protein
VVNGSSRRAEKPPCAFRRDRALAERIQPIPPNSGTVECAHGRMRGESWVHERTLEPASGGRRKRAYPPYGPMSLPLLSATAAQLTAIKPPAAIRPRPTVISVPT